MGREANGVGIVSVWIEGVSRKESFDALEAPT